MSTTPTVFLIDDEPDVLKATSRLLRIAGFSVRPFESAVNFFEQYDDKASGCMVIDLSMPEMDGIEVQRQLISRGSVLPIVFLTGRGDVATTAQAMKLGATDFLTKPVQGEDLFAVIRACFEKNRAARIDRDERLIVARRLALLTPREREVLEHLITGQLNKQIARDLGIVEKTIKVHRAQVLKKMEAGSIAELVTLAALAGLHPAHQTLS